MRNVVSLLSCLEIAFELFGSCSWVIWELQLGCLEVAIEVFSRCTTVGFKNFF